MNEPAILIVDDEGPVVRALKRELSDLADDLKCVLKPFSSSPEALDFIKDNPDDVAVLISDQRMPEMKGSELIEKAKGINGRIESILLTAYTDMEEIIKSIRTGLASFIQKPWKEDDLLGEVRKAYETYRRKKDDSRRNDLLRGELERGGSIQQKFLTPHLPEDKRFYFSVKYEPSLDCGGDFYHAMAIDHDNYLFIIGDVAGHGVKSAFVTFILKTLFNESTFKSFLYENISVKRLMTWINMRIYQELKNIQPMLVSLCLCHLDLADNRLTVCNGGHLFPLIHRNNKIIDVDASGTALGFRTDIAYEEHTLPLQEYDRIILYTDGLEEIKGGKETLKGIFLFHGNNRYFTSLVMDEIKGKSKPARTKDDMTLMTIELNR